MAFTIERADKKTAVVHFGPTLDFRNADDFKAASHAEVKAGIRRFVLDFAETRVLDSAGLGAIFSLQRKVFGVGGRIVFAAASRPVQAIVKAVYLYRVFAVYKTVGDAVVRSWHS